MARAKPGPKPRAFPPTLSAAARTKLYADAGYGLAFDNYFRGLPTLKSAEFWPLLDAFAGIVADEVRRGWQNPVEKAADELFRLVRSGESAACRPAYDFHTAALFVRTYAAVVAELDDALGEADLGRSDDSFGDLTDALPLAGRTAHARLLKAGSATTAMAVLGLVKDQALPPLVKLITEGENFVFTCLWGVLKGDVPDQVREGLPPKEQARLRSSSI